MSAAVPAAAHVGATQAAYNALRSEIERGVFGAGRRLPAERTLAENLGVSRTTLRKALTLLEADGLVRATPNSGWTVATPEASDPPATLRSFTEMAQARGLTPTTEVLSEVVASAGLDEAERLRLAPTAPVVRLSRLRSLNGIPVCVNDETLPAAIAADLPDMTNRSLYAVLDQRGVSVARSAFAVQAVACDDRMAKLLAIAPGTPVLRGEETAYADDGLPIIVGVSHYRGDAYRFTADLFRSRS
jgi:GntR family transcriptional regulator